MSFITDFESHRPAKSPQGIPQICRILCRQSFSLIEPYIFLLSRGLADPFSPMDLALFVEDTFDVRIEDTAFNANTFDNLNQLALLSVSRK